MRLAKFGVDHQVDAVGTDFDRRGQPLPCWSLFTEGRITYDGHLSVCCFDHDGRFNMGDLNRMSFMQAWHSAPFQALRQANLDENICGTVCEKCIAYVSD